MKLDTYLRRTQTSSRDFARKVGASISAVRKWRQKARIPRRAMLLKIKATTKGRVSPHDWY